jgi:hypothetical protein
MGLLGNIWKLNKKAKGMMKMLHFVVWDGIFEAFC